MKLLSVTVPCYNSQAYMRNCVDSLLEGGELVEILIVDDGSKDDTAKIADEYAAKYPTIVKAIHQENSGHGGAVNTGIKNATGLYFKVVDSDDWVNAEAYHKILDKLEEITGGPQVLDMMISNFVYEKQGAKRKKIMRYKKYMPEGEIFTWKEMGRMPLGKYILMHSVIYRTGLLRECGLELPTHTFYVDNLFVYQPLPSVRTMYYMDVNFYRYFIGREDQSVHEDVMIRRIDQQIRVNKLMIDAIAGKKNIGKNIRRYMLRYLEIIMAVSSIMLIRSGTEENLEMPFSVGNLKAQGGRLYADFIVPEFLEGTTHPRVYYAAGNCLIGNIDNNPESMAVAWLSGMDATSMVGYVVPTWYGRNGWGGLKYWAANAGRLTLAQAVYLNQQDMLHTEYLWNPAILSINYPFMDLPLREENEFERRFIEATGQKPTKDQHGFVHDRDVVVFYGDPAWEVKLASIQPLGYQVDFKVKGRKCIITITTDASFDGGLMKGGKLKQEHVADIPFACYFPKRLKNPKLSAGQDWECALAEDFILVYNCDFERNNSYTIILDIN